MTKDEYDTNFARNINRSHRLVLKDAIAMDELLNKEYSLGDFIRRHAHLKQEYSLDAYSKSLRDLLDITPMIIDIPQIKL